MHVAVATVSAMPPEFDDDERLAAALGAGEVDGRLVLGAEGRERRRVGGHRSERHATARGDELVGPGAAARKSP